MDFVAFQAAIQAALCRLHAREREGSGAAAAFGILIALMRQTSFQRALFRTLQEMRLV